MSLLFYFDKFTAWLDFSWLITRPNKEPINKEPTYSALATDLPPMYVCETAEIKLTVGEEKPLEDKLNEAK